MIGKELLGKKPVSLAEVRELLKSRTENGTPTYEQTQSDEYVKKFARLSKAKALELNEELLKIEGLDGELRVKISDLLPEDLEALKVLLPKNAKISEQDLNGILKHVKKYAST